MITIRLPIPETEPSPEILGTAPEKCVFFDIETTGFKSGFAKVYLIGAAFRQRNGWTLMQWLCERPEEECALLQVFSAFLQPFERLIHFNGDRFDIPFLSDRYRSHSLPVPFEAGMASIDLFTALRPCKSLFGLDHMNQTSLERFMGISREDRFDGGVLIQVFRDNCRCPDEEKKQMLFLHNREDVIGLLHLTRLLGYTRLHRCRLLEARVISDPPSSLELTLQPDSPLPVPLDLCANGCRLRLAHRTIHLQIPLYQGILYSWFENYKEYDYLPMEDIAIHRSVSVFVEKSHRSRATARTAYTKKEGLFLPQPDGVFSPCFGPDYEHRKHYTELTEKKLQDQAFLQQYYEAMVTTCFAVPCQ